MEKLELIVVQAPAGVPLARERIGFLDGVSKGKLTIGRDPVNDLSLSDPHRFVSSAHAMVVNEEGRYYLLDISTNGVFLNGSEHAIGQNKQVLLADGDLIEIGEFQIRVDIYRVVEEEFRASSQQSPVKRHAFEESSDRASLDEEDIASVSQARLASEAVGGVLKLLGYRNVDALSEGKVRALEQLLVLILKEALMGLQQLSLDLPQTRGSSGSLAKSGQGSNPLRFVPDIDQLLKALMGELGGGYGAPIASIRETVADIDHHQRALHLGGEKAIQELLSLLSPESITDQVAGGAFNAETKEALYWQAYKQSYCQLQALLGRTQEGFSPLFSNGYRIALDELTRDEIEGKTLQRTEMLES